MSQEKQRKRVNIVVDVEKYERLKKILDVMGITITSFFDETMTDFINNMEDAVLNHDKDVFFKMMTKNIEQIQNQLQEELKK